MLKEAALYFHFCYCHILGREGSTKKGSFTVARNSKDILTREDIDIFFAKLKTTVAAAEAAEGFRELAAKLNSSFGGAPTSSRAASTASTSAKAKTKGRRKRQAGIDPETVLAIVAAGAKNGVSVGDVASKIGEEDKQRVAAALRKLRDAKKAKLKGEKRLARWYPA